MADLLESHPRDAQDLQAAIEEAAAAQVPLEVSGKGTKRALGRPVDARKLLDLSALDGVIDYEPSELVLTARPATPLEDVERLLAQSGDAEGAADFARRAERTRRALVEKCWDAERGLFFDLAGPEERMLRVNTVSSLLPLALPELPREIAARLVAHVEDPREYAAAYPVPSVAMDEPSFVAGRCGDKMVWRGPTWMNTNWYLWRGLRAHGRGGYHGGRLSHGGLFCRRRLGDLCRGRGWHGRAGGAAGGQQHQRQRPPQAQENSMHGFPFDCQ